MRPVAILSPHTQRGRCVCGSRRSPLASLWDAAITALSGGLVWTGLVWSGLSGAHLMGATASTTPAQLVAALRSRQRRVRTAPCCLYRSGLILR